MKILHTEHTKYQTVLLQLPMSKLWSDRQLTSDRKIHIKCNYYYEMQKGILHTPQLTHVLSKIKFILNIKCIKSIIDSFNFQIRPKCIYLSVHTHDNLQIGNIFHIFTSYYTQILMTLHSFWIKILPWHLYSASPTVFIVVYLFYLTNVQKHSKQKYLARYWRIIIWQKIHTINSK